MANSKPSFLLLLSTLLDSTTSLLKTNRIKNQNKESFALVIDGVTLACLFSTNLKSQFLDICLNCDAVLCCRMTPAQKAEVFQDLFKRKWLSARCGDRTCI